MKTTSFPSEVQDQLKHYVYRLIDPRNGETFYVGKGQGNRVFDHARGDINENDDGLPDKLRRIRDIRLAGLEVAHVIHRHGIEDKETAFEIEAALMDAYSTTTNIAGGTNNNDNGVMHADEIMTKYAAPEAVFKHSVVAITVNHTALESSIYEAVRFSWKVDQRRVEKADYVLAVVRGVIVGAFVAEKWIRNTPENFPDHPYADGKRFAFIGREAESEIFALYVNKRIPARLRKQGAANPVRYIDPET